MKTENNAIIANADDKVKVLGLQELAEVAGGRAAMDWSTASNDCGSVASNEWSTQSNGCKDFR
jgi:hypothetical protein